MLLCDECCMACLHDFRKRKIATDGLMATSRNTRIIYHHIMIVHDSKCVVDAEELLSAASL